MYPTANETRRGMQGGDVSTRLCGAAHSQGVGEAWLRSHHSVGQRCAFDRCRPKTQGCGHTAVIRRADALLGSHEVRGCGLRAACGEGAKATCLRFQREIRNTQRAAKRREPLSQKKKKMPTVYCQAAGQHVIATKCFGPKVQIPVHTLVSAGDRVLHHFIFFRLFPFQ